MGWMDKKGMNEWEGGGGGAWGMGWDKVERGGWVEVSSG